MKYKAIDEGIKNKKLCGSCTACCEYVNIPIESPKDEQDVDHILWYLLHKNIYVWIGKDKAWYVRFNTRCKPLKRKLCSRYASRPFICRDYTHKVCEKHDLTKDEKHSFHNQEQLLAYLKKKKIPYYDFYDW